MLLGSVRKSGSANFKKGVAGVQASIGLLYARGDRVPQDYENAIKWYTLSAEQGNADAQSSLGFMYGKGLGVPRNDKTEVKWYRLAAEQGDAFAQYDLG